MDSFAARRLQCTPYMMQSSQGVQSSNGLTRNNTRNNTGSNILIRRGFGSKGEPDTWLIRFHISSPREGVCAGGASAYLEVGGQSSYQLPTSELSSVISSATFTKDPKSCSLCHTQGDFEHRHVSWLKTAQREKRGAVP